MVARVDVPDAMAHAGRADIGRGTTNEYCRCVSPESIAGASSTEVMARLDAPHCWPWTGAGRGDVPPTAGSDHTVGSLTTSLSL